MACPEASFCQVSSCPCAPLAIDNPLRAIARHACATRLSSRHDVHRQPLGADHRPRVVQLGGLVAGHRDLSVPFQQEPERELGFELASGAPKQKWMPFPKVRGGLGVRRMSNRSGSGNCVASRLAEAIHNRMI